MNEFAWPIVIALVAILVLFVYSRLTASGSKIMVNGKPLSGPVGFLVSVIVGFFALAICFVVFSLVGMFLVGLPVFLLFFVLLLIVGLILFLVMLPFIILTCIVFGVGRCTMSKIFNKN